METKIICKNKYFKIIIAILIPLVLGFLVSMCAVMYKEPWYTKLQRPSYNPPEIVFPFVWTIIYIMIGYASYRVFEKGFDSGKARYPLKLYLIHLFFNVTWTITFFCFQSVGLSVIHIIIVFISLVFTGLFFYRVDKIAGLLFIPYGFWVTFASCVCVAIFRMN